MHHSVYPLHRALDTVAITDISLHQLGTGIQIGRGTGRMNLRVETIQNSYGSAARDEAVHHERADKACSTRDKDGAHGPEIGGLKNRLLLPS